MKNFFYFSSVMYTLAIVLLVVMVVAWPSPATPAGPPTQTGIALLSFVVAIAGFTSFCFGLWDKYHEKGE
ncbi:MAG TPA: hypothetical protein VJJ02_04440 [Candidatus Paceibacterota bacterium]